jgi:hypothetical protein
MTLLAVAGAYAAGFFGRKTVMPAFSFLGYPEMLTEIIGGVAAGLLTYFAIHGLRNILFKKTKDIAGRGSRIRSGTMGAVLGFTFGLLMFAASYYAIRMMGTIASSQVQVATAGQEALRRAPAPGMLAPQEPSAIIKGLARLNDALNEGHTGEILHKVDRVPPNVYAMLFKLGIMVSSEEAVERFLMYPGVATLAHHPKLATLKNDPVVADLLSKKSYLRLLRNEKVVALANDREFAEQIKEMNFEKALDHAITGGNAPGAAPVIEVPTQQSVP